ncbi:MAG: hypothetical protein WCP39_00120, partial [Chlamydiota bacterium]
MISAQEAAVSPPATVPLQVTPATVSPQDTLPLQTTPSVPATVSLPATLAPQAILPPRTEKEELFLRRIVDFWESGDKSLVGREIEKYFRENSVVNDFTNYLHGFLGDVYIEEKRYEEALSEYTHITNSEVKEKIFANILHALHALKKYDVLEKECIAYLQNKDPANKKFDSTRFFLAESFYQQALISLKEEDKKELFVKARKGFSDLTSSDFVKPSLQTLALIAKELHEEKGASAIFEELANKYPEEKEEFLFQAAIAQGGFDKELAIQTFSQIFHEGKKKVWESGYNRLLLLFETEHYSEVILAKDQVFNMIPEAKVPFLFFITGKSYFTLGDFRRAATELKKYINKEEKTSSEVEHALSLLLSCANNLEDKELFDETLHHLTALYPNSTEMPTAFFARALLSKKKENFAASLHDFQEIEERWATFPDRENFVFEYAHLLYQTKDWENSRLRFHSFIKEFPTHVQISLAWNYLLQASIELSKKENQTMYKKNLIADIESFIEKGPLSTENEKQEYRFVLARTKFEIEDRAGASLLLQPLHEIASFPHAAEVSLLLALCSREEKKEEKVYSQYLQEALALDKDHHLSHGAIHLSLFNSYLTQAALQSNLIDQAAEHLYQAQKEISTIQ